VQIAVVSPARWSLFRLSKQYTAMALAELGHEVLYVDPPVSVGSALRDRDRIRDLRGPRLTEAAPGLRVWRPVVAPGQNSTAGQRVNAALLSRGIHRLLPRLELTIGFSLESRGVLRRLPGRRVYYCTDSFEDLPGADAEQVRRFERELVDVTDVTVACSLPLQAQLEARGAPVAYLPHATDDDALAAPAAPPPELASLPRPRVAYLGSLNFRIDPALLRAARRAAGAGTLVIIGDAYGPAVDPAVNEVLRSANVVAVGNKPGPVLSTYLAATDAAVVPYSSAAFNRKSFPIKVLQYLAAGLPVVSSTNGATDELGGVVEVADTPPDFERALTAALENDDEPQRAMRRELAASRRWTDNARRLLEIAGA
jgi:teichuronic acid biosynthesis glycosyltransferase TuaH